MNSNLNVTTWSARKRHLASEGSNYTRCHAGVIRPGDQCVGHWHQPITQQDIDALDLCKTCSGRRK